SSACLAHIRRRRETMGDDGRRWETMGDDGRRWETMGLLAKADKRLPARVETRRRAKALFCQPRSADLTVAASQPLPVSAASSLPDPSQECVKTVHEAKVSPALAAPPHVPIARRHLRASRVKLYGAARIPHARRASYPVTGGSTRAQARCRRCRL